MKIIHCADIHIGSACLAVADPIMRRRELVSAFERLLQYAEDNNVEIVIIAGDLFDNNFVTQSEIADVAYLIERINVKLYILKGNHGATHPYSQLARCNLNNVFYFEDNWTYYNIDNITIVGAEAIGDSGRYQDLNLSSDRFNIVVLHGDVNTAEYGIIDCKQLVTRGANYVALGHRHSYQVVLDVRDCKCVYCGVLETRGFDEMRGSGFVVIDTVTKQHQFVSQHIRQTVKVTVDITSVGSNLELANLVIDTVSKYANENYINIELVGTLNGIVSIDSLADKLSYLWAVRIDNNTTADIDIEAIKQEQSLRSEVLRLSERIDDERQRRDVQRLCIMALAGEDIVW